MSKENGIIALLELPAPTLAELAVALRDGSLQYGISAGLLSSFAGSNASVLAGSLNALVALGCTIPALAVICEGMAIARGQLDKLNDDVFLTLSGPEVPGIPVVNTSAVVRALFEEAKQEVLITSYVFHNAKEILAPLANKYAVEPAFKVRIIVDLTHSRKSPDEPLPIVAGRFKREFLEKHWTGTREPEFWHDPRVFEAEDRTKAGIMHAKVVIIDHAAALVTSANFTEAAQSRNIEAGVQTRNPHQVVRLKNYFDALIRLGMLKPLIRCSQENI